MRYLNLLTNGIADLVMAPFAWQNPWPALIVVSLLATIFLLLVFKFSSNQEAIRRSKGRLISRTLELLLFQHDLVESIAACGRIFIANLHYLRQFMFPLVAGLIPCLLILIQLACWYVDRPFKVGETAILEVRLRPGTPVTERNVTLGNSNLLAVETEGLRIPKTNEIDWRLRAQNEGTEALQIQVDGVAVSKQIAVGTRLQKVSGIRPGAGFWDELFYPAEPPLDEASGIERITIKYPPRQLLLGTYEIDWVIAFLVLTLVFGLLLKGWLKVNL